MRIFSPACHTGGMYELSKIVARGHTLTLWESGAWPYGWQDRQRPRPSTVRFTTDFDEIKEHDVAIAHVGLWTGIRQETRMVLESAIPRIVHVHSCPSNDEGRKLVAGEVVLFNSPRSQREWGSPDGSAVVLSSVDVSEWPVARGRGIVVDRNKCDKVTRRALQAAGVEARIIQGASWGDYKRQLSDASVYVMPSEIQNFPRSRVEAMACGLCVVSLDVAGESEIYENGNQMWLARNMEDLGRLTLSLWHDNRMARATGQRARTWVEHEQRLSRWLDGVEMLLRAAMGSKQCS